MPLQIEKRDITTMESDIIVTPTDCYYSGSGGTDYAIHKAAGYELDEACKKLSPLFVGRVAYTEAFNLKSKYIIHTVGPMWNGGGYNEEVLLKSCYLNALSLAVNLKARSIAFPLISSGTFGFPKDRVLRIAIDTISDFFNDSGNELDVTICVVDKNSFTLNRESALMEFICNSDRQNKNYDKSVLLDEIHNEYCDCQTVEMFEESCEDKQAYDDEISYAVALPKDTVDFSEKNIQFQKIRTSKEFVPKLDDGFAVTLLKLIDKKGMDDVECYKKANVSKQTFSKIINNKNYNPNKKRVISFAISVQVTLDETEELLRTVGFSLSHSNMFDLIIEFYIKNGIYDIFEINAALYKYDQVTLGC
ncbi:MAG: macro domain-containing protein [Ruminococcus sp.]|nr:macro domain-containing protein [Candidatus Copronaster equi]